MQLRAHRELRRVLQLGSVPDYTTLKRMAEQKIDQVLGEAACCMGGVGRRRRHARVAVDATGLAQGAVSTFFVRRRYHRTGQPLPWRHWLKWLVTVDVDRQLLLSQAVRRSPWNDCANLPTLVEAANQVTPIGVVLADAEFNSERRHTYMHQKLHTRSIIPAKRGKKTWRIHGVRAEMRHAFPRRQYARRALVETVFSTIKHKLSAHAPGRSLFTPMCQALLLGFAYNLYGL